MFYLIGPIATSTLQRATAFAALVLCLAAAGYSQAGAPRVNLLATVKTDDIESLAFSPDGARLEVVTKAGMQIIETESGRLVRTEPRSSVGARPPIDDLVWPELGERLQLLVLKKDAAKRLVVWDRIGRRTISELKGFSRKLMKAVFSGGDRRVLTMSEPTKSGIWNDDRICEFIVWETATGKMLSRLTLKGVDSYTSPSISPDGESFVTQQRELGYEVDTKIWDAATGKLKLKLTAPPRKTADGRDIDPALTKFENLRFTKDGKLILATTSDVESRSLGDGSLAAFDASTGEAVWQTDDLVKNPESYWAVCLSSDEKILVAIRYVSLSFLKDAITAEVRETATGKLLATLRNPDPAENEIVYKPLRGNEESLVLSPSASYLITGGVSRAEVWRLPAGRRLCSFPRAWNPYDTLFGDPEDTDLFTFRADERIIAAQGHRRLRLWNAETCELIRKVETFIDGGAVWSADERLIATVAKDKKTIQILRIE